MSLKDFPNFDGSADFANAASAGLSVNTTTLLDEPQLFLNPDYFGNSPAISFFSTPELGYLDTPDTVISHDFDLAYSPQLSRENSHKSVDNYGSSKDPMFEDVTLFPSTTFDDSVNTAFNTDANSTELFVDAASLELTPRVEHATILPATPALTPASSFEMPPPRSKPSSYIKMQRGRKRHSSDGDYIPQSILGKRSASHIDDEEDLKAVLRAKNTEAAARSRARKKAAMEDAEKKIAELEAENASLKQQLALALEVQENQA